MPTGSTGQMVQSPWMQDPSVSSGPSGAMSGIPFPTSVQPPNSQAGQGGLSQALQGLQLFNQMKGQANPQGNVPPGMGMSGHGGVPTQPSPPGGVIGALAQIAPMFMGG